MLKAKKFSPEKFEQIRKQSSLQKGWYVKKSLDDAKIIAAALRDFFKRKNNRT